MKPNEIKALFPMEIFITQKMIDEANYTSRDRCIAANALRSLLPEELSNEIDWGTGIGRIDGIPIRCHGLAKDGKWEQVYLQKANVFPMQIKFFIDSRK